MPIPGNLLTTAMAVMPHTNVDRSLEVALSMDILFWPQQLIFFDNLASYHKFIRIIFLNPAENRMGSSVECIHWKEP